MRSHVTCIGCSKSRISWVFQYRKRYEITCDTCISHDKICNKCVSIPQAVWDHMWLQKILHMATPARVFQYRKRYEITCDKAITKAKGQLNTSFNTASGMRSHVTWIFGTLPRNIFSFQYRKRYEITCDYTLIVLPFHRSRVSIPQAVWDHMWLSFEIVAGEFLFCFNTASGMRSHVTWS